MNKVVRGYKRQFWRGVVATLAATYGVVLVLAAPTYAVGGGATQSRLLLIRKMLNLNRAQLDIYIRLLLK